MSSLALLPSNAVELDGARTFTTSMTVAAIFGREHYNVLRDIESLDCSQEFRALNFEGTSRDVPGPNGGVRQERAFKIYRDGFTFLAMGYTGPKAAQFKEAYINRFNEMEAALRQPTAATPGERFIATHTGKQWILFGIPDDASVLPHRDWPGVIRTTDFPKDLLPDVLTAVSERMKGLPPPPAQVRPERNFAPRSSDVSGKVLDFIERSGRDGLAKRDLIQGCKGFRLLSSEQRNSLIDKLISLGSVVEVETTNTRGPKGKRLVHAKFGGKHVR